MFSKSDLYPNASKAFFESQVTAYSELKNIAIQATQKIVELNMAAAKASTEDVVAAMQGLLGAKDPQSFFSLATEYARPGAEKIAAYGQHLTDILSATKAEFTKVIEAQVAEVQGNVTDLVETIAKNAPAGSESAIAMLKSTVENANVGYEKMSSAVKQADETTKEQVAKASTQLTEVVKKAAAK